jgi:nitrous oxide reductase
MLEGIAMCIALAGMGIYFVKSTDLPKDMNQRSEQMRASSPIATNTTKKYSFPVDLEKRQAIQEKQENLMRENLLEEQAKKQAKIALHNKKIDEITLLITTLEQEIKDNVERNAIIQKQINLHLDTLKTLKETQIA